MTTKEYDNNIDGLSLHHYVNCDENTSDEIKTCRGIIYDENKKIVCKSFGYTPEIPSNEKEKLQTLLPNGVFIDKNTKYYVAEEGFILRLFFFKNKWYLSTHKKLNAFDSYWSSSNSCGNIFIRSIESLNRKSKKLEYEDIMDLYDRFCNTLDKNFIYTFLVRNTPESRIVCETTFEPTCYLVGIFDIKNNFTLVDKIPTCVDWIPTPEELYFSSLNDLIKHVDKIEIEECQGVIVHTSNGKQLKVMNPTYIEYFNVRNNEPNIYVRFLQLRLNKDDTLKKFMKLYSSMVYKFEDMELQIFELAQKITNSYIQRYIHKKYIVVPQKQFFIMQELHIWHRENPNKNKISLDKTLELLDTKDGLFLFSLLRENVSSEKEEDDEKYDEEDYNNEYEIDLLSKQQFSI